MTLEQKVAIAGVVLWVSLAFNAGLFVWNVVSGFYTLALLQSIGLSGLTAWLAIVPKIHAQLDAQLRQALAQQRISELSLQLVEQQMRAGHVRVNITGDAERMH